MTDVSRGDGCLIRLEVRLAYSKEIEGCWEVEAPHWGNGIVADYKELWKDHEGGDTWVLLFYGGIVASMTVFHQPQFGLPPSSIGVGCLFVRRPYRRLGYGSYLLERVLERNNVSNDKPAFGFSDIDPEYYVKLGAKILPPIVDRSVICERCRHPKGQLVVFPNTWEPPIDFDPPIYF